MDEVNEKTQSSVQKYLFFTLSDNFHRHSGRNYFRFAAFLSCFSLLQVRNWIDSFVVPANFEMEVRSGGLARLAHFCNGLSSLYETPLFH